MLNLREQQTNSSSRLQNDDRHLHLDPLIVFKRTNPKQPSLRGRRRRDLMHTLFLWVFPCQEITFFSLAQWAKLYSKLQTTVLGSCVYRNRIKVSMHIWDFEMNIMPQSKGQEAWKIIESFNILLFFNFVHPTEQSENLGLHDAGESKSIYWIIYLDIVTTKQWEAFQVPQWQNSIQNEILSL